MLDRRQGATESDAWRFLCLCLGSRWDPAALQEVRDLSSEVAGCWEQAAALAREEFLVPLMYHTLRGEGLVSPPVEKEWRSVYHSSILHSTRLFHQLTRVLHGLAGVHCPVLLLKGAALAETVYGNAALRPMVDLDLLVPASQIDLAQSVLAHLGYTSLTSDPWSGHSRRYRNSLSYQHESGGGLPFLVGLHWDLFDIPYYYGQIPMDGWFARAQPACIAGVEAQIPAVEDHLVYLCGHLVLHHQQEPSLLRYHDVALLTRPVDSRVDWDAVMQRAAEWRLVLPLQHVLGRLQELWPGMLPPGVLQEIGRLRPTRTEQWVHDWVVGRRRTPATDSLLYVATLPGLPRKAGFLLEAAFPSPAYMRERYVPQRPGLWPLAYGQRAGLALRYLLQRSG